MTLGNPDFNKNMKKTNLFIYKSEPQFYKFYGHSQLYIESERHSLFLAVFLSCLDYIKKLEYLTLLL